MGYIEKTDVGNVYITDINDWFATLSNLNRECKNYIDSEIRYKEILAEHDKQIRAEVIDECIEMLEGDCFVSGTASKVLIHHFEQLKENK